MVKKKRKSHKKKSGLHGMHCVSHYGSGAKKGRCKRFAKKSAGMHGVAKKRKAKPKKRK